MGFNSAFKGLTVQPNVPRHLIGQLSILIYFTNHTFLSSCSQLLAFHNFLRSHCAISHCYDRKIEAAAMVWTCGIGRCIEISWKIPLKNFDLKDRERNGRITTRCVLRYAMWVGNEWHWLGMVSSRRWHLVHLSQCHLTIQHKCLINTLLKGI